MNPDDRDVGPSLDEETIERFSRQIILRELGGHGQRRLLASSCRVIGDGIAAQVCAAYLIAAGVGRVDESASLSESPAPRIPLAWDAGAPAAVARLEVSTSLARCDLWIDAAGGSPCAPATGLATAAPPSTGRAPEPMARDMLVLARGGDGSQEIYLKPAESESAAIPCTAGPASGRTELAPEVADQALAGAFLALIACHRLLEWPESVAPRRWRLERGAAGWVES